MALNSRSTQVIARVSLVDGLGRAVAGATVNGAWSGAIASGDTSRTTDANGVATFYSAQSRATGTVKFCVTSASASGLTYDAAQNLATCNSLTK
jgi:hypothetical protein